MKKNWVLYVFVKTDMESMNFGKACAQSSHCSNSFIYENYISDTASPKHKKNVKEWMSETTQGFGTQINLKVPDDKHDELVKQARDLGFAANQIVDPTYPYFVSPEIAKLLPETLHTAPMVPTKDKVVCFRNEVTAGYIFGDKDELSILLSKYPLHP